MTISSVIAKNLKLLRKISGVTQQRLSNTLELNYRHYQSIEAGKVDLKVSTLERLATHFQIPLQCFFSPVLSMASINLSVFNFPLFTVQVCDTQELRCLEHCRGTKEMADFEGTERFSLTSFAYPLQEGRKRISNMLNIQGKKASDKGVSSFTFKACVNDAGKFCIPEEAKKISHLNMTLIKAKRGEQDVFVLFSPRAAKVLPLP